MQPQGPQKAPNVDLKRPRKAPERGPRGLEQASIGPTNPDHGPVELQGALSSLLEILEREVRPPRRAKESFRRPQMRPKMAPKGPKMGSKRPPEGWTERVRTNM